MINSTLSKTNERFLTFDIKDFYYNTPISRFKYMKLALDIIPPEIVDQYKLRGLDCLGGWVYLRSERA